MNVMPVEEVIERAETICRKHGVTKLTLIGSFATGTATPVSDVDLVVYGCEDIPGLEADLQSIETLRPINLFEYESIHNEYLPEDICKYGRQIY